MNNPPIQQIIYQNQCTYWYWSIFLNLLSIGNILLGWDFDSISLFQWNGEKFVLVFSAAEKKDEEWAKKDDVEWLTKDDVKWTSQEGLKERTEEDIIIESEHPDLKQPRKPVEGLILGC